MLTKKRAQSDIVTHQANIWNKVSSMPKGLFTTTCRLNFQSGRPRNADGIPQRAANRDASQPHEDGGLQPLEHLRDQRHTVRWKASADPGARLQQRRGQSD